MKTLTAAADRATKRPYAAPVYLAQIDFTSPTAKTLRVSDRYVSALGQEWLPLVAAWGTLEQALNTVDVDGRPATAEITFFNTKAVEGKARISDLIRTPFNVDGTFEWAFAKMTIFQLFEGLGSGDEVPLGVFFLEEPTEIGEHLLTVRMSDESLVLEETLQVTRVTRALFPLCPEESIGRSIPRPFGVLTNVPAVAVIDSALSHLIGAITATATSLTLEDASRFPASGTIQIDSEHLTYSGKAGNQLTGLTRAANATTAAIHAHDATVYEVRQGSQAYRYAVAEHAGAFTIRSVTNVAVNGNPPTVGSSVELQETALVAGRTLAVISLPREAKFFEAGGTTAERDIAVSGATITMNGDVAGDTPWDGLTVKVETRTVPPASIGGTVSTERTLNAHVTRGSGRGGVVKFWITRQLSGDTEVQIAAHTWQSLEGSTVSVSDTRVYGSTADEIIRFKYWFNDTGGSEPLTWVNDQYHVKDTSTALAGGGPTSIGPVTCDIEGLQDDASGTLTGTPSALLENPADITRFILSQLYGIASSGLGTTWAATRNTLAGLSFKWAFVLEFVLFSQLRRKLGEQARSVLYLEAGTWEYKFLTDAPVADLTLDYERDVWQERPATVRRSARTDVRNSLTVLAQRDLASADYRYVKLLEDLTGFATARQHDFTLDFVQDTETADRLAGYWLGVWKQQRFEVDLVAWWNILPLALLDYVALSNHPVLEAYGAEDLIFRVVGKRYLPGDEHSGRIALRLVDTTVAHAPAEDLVQEEAVNYSFNGDVEIWGAGAASPPTGWTLTGAGATVARDGTNKKLGTYAVGLTRVGADGYLSQRPDTFAGFGPVAWWQGRQVTFGCWVRATVASRARLVIDDGVGQTASAYHAGNSAFSFLTVTRTIDAAATRVEIRLVVDSGDTTAQFDGATLIFGATLANSFPSGWRGRRSILRDTSEGGTVVANATSFLGATVSATESAVQVQVPFKGVARNLTTQASATPGASQTYTYTLRKNGADTALTVTRDNTSAFGADLTNEVECAKLDKLATKLATSVTATVAVHSAEYEYEEIP